MTSQHAAVWAQRFLNTYITTTISHSVTSCSPLCHWEWVWHHEETEGFGYCAVHQSPSVKISKRQYIDTIVSKIQNTFVKITHNTHITMFFFILIKLWEFSSFGALANNNLRYHCNGTLLFVNLFFESNQVNLLPLQHENSCHGHWSLLHTRSA